MGETILKGPIVLNSAYLGTSRGYTAYVVQPDIFLFKFGDFNKGGQG